MRYLLALLSIVIMPFAWADVVITLVDQHNQPVPDAIISVPNVAADTSTATAVMDQRDTSFMPHVLVIQKGQYVRFPNRDDIRHHVYSFSAAKSFEIKLFKGANMAPILFDKPGLVVLGCNIHDSMIGYIFVADQYVAVKTNAQGQATIPAKLGDDIVIWSEYFVEGIQTVKQAKISAEKAQTIVLELLPSFEAAKQSDHQYHYDS